MTIFVDVSKVDELIKVLMDYPHDEMYDFVGEGSLFVSVGWVDLVTGKTN